MSQTGKPINEVEFADKLSTPRTISLSGAVTSTPATFDGSRDVDIPINKVYQSSLNWNGESGEGKLTPLGTALSDENSANRIAFINPDAVKIEYSTDGGESWEEWQKSEANDITKVKLCTLTSSIGVGNTTPITVNHRTRITLIGRDRDTGIGYLYNNVNKMLVEVSAPHEMEVTVETQKGVSDEWFYYGTYKLFGYSGWNDLPIVLDTFGGHENQTYNVWKIRLTFKITAVNDSTNTTYSRIWRIRMFGSEQWITPNNFYSRNGHIYEIDYAQNTYFPKDVYIRGNKLRIGSTDITETQLQALLALLT